MLSNTRSAASPSLPGAENGFRAATAPSNSHSEIGGALSCESDESKLATSSSIPRWVGEVEGRLVGKKWSAQPLAMMDASEERRPSIRRLVGRLIVLDFPERAERDSNVSEMGVFERKWAHDLDLALRSSRWYWAIWTREIECD